MNKFNERLRLLVEESGLNKCEFAKRVGIPPSTFAYYLKDREPKYDILIDIAVKCNTTPNWLIGFSEERNGNDSFNKEINHYRNVLNKISELANISKPFK